MKFLIPRTPRSACCTFLVALLLSACSDKDPDDSLLGPGNSSQPTGGQGSMNEVSTGGQGSTTVGAAGGGAAIQTGGAPAEPGSGGTTPSDGGSSSGSGGGNAMGSGGLDSATGGVQVGSGGAFAGDSDTPVGRHGHLGVSGTQLVDEIGEAVQLKGVSSQWLNWESDGYALNLEALVWMRDNWNLSLIRAAMGADPSAGGSYLDENDPEAGKADMLNQVKVVIDNAIEAGVYVLVDFHSHTAHLHEAEAADFFKQIIELYGDRPNLLFEPFNEPKDVSSSDTVEWADIKPYFESIVSTIRDNDPDENDNVVILGTPRWSQDVDHAALSPLTGSNLMYTIHFYSCTHGDKLLDVAKQALLDGLPLFATEWGATEADGGVDGTPVCETEANKWHDWMDANSISWAAWKLDDCDGLGAADTSCLLNRDVPLNGAWEESDLNGHGAYVVSKLKN